MIISSFCSFFGGRFRKCHDNKINFSYTSYFNILPAKASARYGNYGFHNFSLQVDNHYTICVICLNIVAQLLKYVGWLKYFNSVCVFKTSKTCFTIHVVVNILTVFIHCPLSFNGLSRVIASEYITFNFFHFDCNHSYILCLADFI